MQPVAIALASKAIATFPFASVSPMIPLPTTLMSNKAVPRNSAKIIRPISAPIPYTGAKTSPVRINKFGFM